MKTKEQINEEVLEKEKIMKEEILEMSEQTRRFNTKYIIYFEDEGQDFLEWHISENGYVLDSKPYQRKIWAGKFTIPQTAKVGGQLAIWNNGESWVNYPIKDIKIIKNKRDFAYAVKHEEVKEE
jgi:hypothetical protein